MTDVLTDETEIERMLRAGVPAGQVAQQLIEPLFTVMHVLERVRRDDSRPAPAPAVVRPQPRPAPPAPQRVASNVQPLAPRPTVAADVAQRAADVPHPTSPQPQPTCEHDRCTEPATRKGLCRRHYDRRRDADRAGKRSREDTIIRTRARNRAVTQLVQAHKDEFDRLMEETREQVMREMYELQAEAAKRGVKAENGIVRLRTGPRPADETIGDRIRTDVGSCPHCHSHHDGGHLCVECGADLTGEGQLASAVGDGTTPQISATEKWRRDGAERGRRLMERRKRETEQAVRRQLRQVR